MNTGIKKIVLEVAGQEIECTPKDLKKLKQDILEIFPEPGVFYYPWHYQPYTIQPYTTTWSVGAASNNEQAYAVRENIIHNT